MRFINLVKEFVSLVSSNRRFRRNFIVESVTKVVLAESKDTQNKVEVFNSC